MVRDRNEISSESSVVLKTQHTRQYNHHVLSYLCALVCDPPCPLFTPLYLPLCPLWVHKERGPGRPWVVVGTDDVVARLNPRSPLATMADLAPGPAWVGGRYEHEFVWGLQILPAFQRFFTAIKSLLLKNERISPLYFQYTVQIFSSVRNLTQRRNTPLLNPF